MAVDTLGDLLALLVAPTNEQDRDQMQKVSRYRKSLTRLEVVFVDEGYTLLL